MFSTFYTSTTSLHHIFLNSSTNSSSPQIFRPCTRNIQTLAHFTSCFNTHSESYTKTNSQFPFRQTHDCAPLSNWTRRYVQFVTCSRRNNTFAGHVQHAVYKQKLASMRFAINGGEDCGWSNSGDYTGQIMSIKFSAITLLNLACARARPSREI